MIHIFHFLSHIEKILSKSEYLQYKTLKHEKSHYTIILAFILKLNYWCPLNA